MGAMGFRSALECGISNFPKDENTSKMKWALRRSKVSACISLLKAIDFFN
jgi:hypothetical protein